MLFRLMFVLVHSNFRFDLYFMYLQFGNSECMTSFLIHERGQSTSGASNTICILGTISACVCGTLAFVTVVNAWKYLQILVNDYI